MTRKSACLLCLALCTVAPGCSLLSGRGNTGSDESVKIHKEALTLPDDIAGPTPDDEVPPPIPTPPPPEPAHRGHVGAIEPLPGLEKPFAGVPGTVTIDRAPPAEQVKNAVYQVPPPAERKISALARALDALQNDRHDDAIRCLREYPEPTQEFFLRILPLLAQVAKKSIDSLSPQELDNMNNLLRGIDEGLRTRCKLLVNKMCFAQRINGFANMVALPDDHAFLAATDDRPGELVLLYVELKNFASVKTKEGDYLTKLTCSLEVYDKNDKRVWGPRLIDKNQTTYRRSACLHDYHGNFSFYVPALPAGTYRLALQIVDETIPEHQRVARESLIFRVTPVTNPLSSR